MKSRLFQTNHQLLYELFVWVIVDLQRPIYISIFLSSALDIKKDLHCFGVHLQIFDERFKFEKTHIINICGNASIPHNPRSWMPFCSGANMFKKLLMVAS
ncbi:hypothetical protein RF11_09647 [Thelohanellus kitauei]|uniref:Uncharacterized protein n=1 Tax=Thelohanellus kitauei TaxID=669202 RepID=A0A0C2J7G5_THEKT|nr:hypothetical protein RF11_09647 [Thelohanellus kitauei]